MFCFQKQSIETVLPFITNSVIDKTPKFNKVKLPKGLNLSKGELRRILKFKEVPYISPNGHWVDHLTHFREEFRFSQQLRGMLIRHADMFYVFSKGDRDSVFLREAYRDSQLIEKDRLLLIKEKLRSLVAVPCFTKRSGRSSDKADGDEHEEDEDDSEGEEDWSDVDNILENEDDDNDDDWSDEDDDHETPPDFDDGDGNISLGKSRQVENEIRKINLLNQCTQMVGQENGGKKKSTPIICTHLIISESKERSYLL
ncbi:hypothetical protein MKW92_042949 [Papaver armeniacum]|nr:hypothetical protein MKW92_042949 [Papaver armeniacum]